MTEAASRLHPPTSHVLAPFGALKVPSTRCLRQLIIFFLIHFSITNNTNTDTDSMTTTSKTVPQINIMSPSPTIKSRRREPRDTGFPEPFNDGLSTCQAHHDESILICLPVRNTTLPHPDADLSPNACISHEDISPERALSRSRRSFLRKKRHTSKHGRISPQSEALYSVLSLVNTDVTDSESIKLVSPSMSSVRYSKDGTESIVSQRDEETPPTSPDVSSHRSKKGGLLRKWRKN